MAPRKTPAKRAPRKAAAPKLGATRATRNRQAVLSVVGNDAPPPRKKYTVAQAASEGSELDILVALRDRIAREVTSSSCPARDLASLSRRLHEITKDIAAIKAAEGSEGDGPAHTADEAFDASSV